MIDTDTATSYTGRKQWAQQVNNAERNLVTEWNSMSETERKRELYTLIRAYNYYHK